MVQDVAIIWPGIAMRVELDERHRPVFFGMRSQQGISDRVITAQRKQFCTAFQNLIGMGLDCRANSCGVVRVKMNVTVVDDRKSIERVKSKGKGLEFCQLHRRRTDRLWAETTTGAECDRVVERNSGHGHVDAFQIAAVVAAQKA